MLSRNLALVLPHPPSWELRESSGRRPAGPTPSGGVVGRSEDGRREPLGAGEETTPSGFSPGCPPGPQQQNPSSKIPGNSAAGALQKGRHENTAPGGGPWGALGVLGGTAGLGALLAWGQLTAVRAVLSPEYLTLYTLLLPGK